MGRMTEWMFWIGLILLFGAGLLFGLAVANAEAGEMTWIAWQGLSGWERGGPVQKTEWEPMRPERYRTLDACRLDLTIVRDMTRAELQRDGETVTIMDFGLRIQYPDGSTIDAIMRCVPSTIHPRVLFEAARPGDASVLWSEVWMETPGGTLVSDEWKIDSAHSTFSSCDRYAAKLVPILDSQYRQQSQIVATTVRGFGLDMHYAGGMRGHLILRCFPATVDPRPHTGR
jgi:hypothetical protein